jgi:hypothetical protein
MASNSDTIYHVLSYIKAHPDRVIVEPGKYDNAIVMYLDDTVKLMNNELLDYFHDQTRVKDTSYHELWITTSHLIKRHKYLVDLSFE